MGLKEGGWRSLGGSVGGWRIIKDEISRMEHVEHNITIGNNVINEEDIEGF